MAFFKLGCNWGVGKPDFYDLLTKHSIIICAGQKMKINDYVAITQGYNVIALAQIVEERQPCTHFDELKEDFVRYQINYEDWNFVAKARIWNLSQTDRFQYQLRKGIRQIHDQATIEKIKSAIRSIMLGKQIQDSIKLLESNHNLILTGAPGTGKTYLAKELAKAMGCNDDEIGFVQFHPSYDYTDFVEGLRPKKGEDPNSIGFEPKNGIFKEFCKNAIESQKTGGQDNFDEAWEKLIKNLFDVSPNPIEIKNVSGKGSFFITLNSNGDGLTSVIKDSSGNWMPKYNYYFNHDQLYRIYKGKKGVNSGSLDNYRRAIVNKMTEIDYGLRNYESGKDKEKKAPYVFIIDEINRGEISKIFGELFFSIDPGYRGKKGKVRTQYANMQSVPNEFDEALGITDPNNNGHFFIPENVYIIGTMNDIDRSVESMDFAFRRRFAFKEIKADENVGMLDNLDASVKDKVINRMKNLNNAISQIEGLSSAYHIGGSYFLKLKNYDNNFDNLWDYHIEGLLREYLRGNPEIEKQISDLKTAYDNED